MLQKLRGLLGDLRREEHAGVGCGHDDLVFCARQFCFFHQHRAIVIGVQLGEEPAEAQAHRACDHADIATSGPFARCTVDDLSVRGSPENRFSEWQQPRDALGCARALHRRSEQHCAPIRQIIGELQRLQHDEPTETVAHEMKLLG